MLDITFDSKWPEESKHQAQKTGQKKTVGASMTNIIHDLTILLN